jgi:carbamoyl-phosphate synthase large subunit
MLGLPVSKPDKSVFDLDYVGVKASQFSFNRLQKADPKLGVDMVSTGEVGCLGEDAKSALLTSMLSVGHRIPKKNVLLSSGNGKQKGDLLQAAQLLSRSGYTIYATEGTSRHLNENGVPNILAYWPDEEGTPQAIDMLNNKEIDLVINIPRNHSDKEITNGYVIRRTAIDRNIPLITNARLASAYIRAFCTIKPENIEIKAWDEF